MRCVECKVDLYITPRAIEIGHCEECWTKVDEALRSLSAPVMFKARLPVLFWEDLRLMATAIQEPATLAKLLDVHPASLRKLLARRSGALDRWMLLRVYGPLFGRLKREWLSILPNRVFLVWAKGRFRKFRNSGRPECRWKRLPVSSAALRARYGYVGTPGNRARPSK